MKKEQKPKRKTKKKTKTNRMKFQFLPSPFTMENSGKLGNK